MNGRGNDAGAWGADRASDCNFLVRNSAALVKYLFQKNERGQCFGGSTLRMADQDDNRIDCGPLLKETLP